MSGTAGNRASQILVINYPIHFSIQFLKDKPIILSKRFSDEVL